MDTLTHALSGALLARAVAAPGAPLSPGRRIVLGAVAAAFPDADFVLSLGSPVTYMLTHRGVTHSFLVLPLWALLLAWLASRIFRDRLGWRAYFATAALGIGIHILGDLITAYGTMIFAPLSDARFSWGTTFIIDLYFTGIILAGLVASGIRRASRAPAAAAIVSLAAYVGAQALLMGRAADIGHEYARAQHLDAAQVSALSRPLSPFNWTIVVLRGDEQRYADVNLLRSADPPEPTAESGWITRLWNSFRPVSSAQWISAGRFGESLEDRRLAKEAWDQASFGFYRWFADYPMLYRIDRGNPSTCVWFQDLRFMGARPGTVPFRYGLCRERDGPWQAYQLVDDKLPRAVQ